MTVEPCPIAGPLVITPKVFEDPRGFLIEAWNDRRYREAGIEGQFVQDNLSSSCRGALRGLHFQKPQAQGKLISVWEGEVFDVAVDIRRCSPTFKQSHGVHLSRDNKRQFYIPAGFAHGFLILSDTAMVHYKCTNFYSPSSEHAIRWDDPEINIAWPSGDRILSEKDGKAPLLRDLPPACLFD